MADKPELQLPDMVTVGDLADKLGIPVVKLIGELFKNGITAKIRRRRRFGRERHHWRRRRFWKERDLHFHKFFARAGVIRIDADNPFQTLAGVFIFRLQYPEALIGTAAKRPEFSACFPPPAVR